MATLYGLSREKIDRRSLIVQDRDERDGLMQMSQNARTDARPGV